MYTTPVYIKVRVRAGAKEESISLVKEGEFQVAVRQKAERNMANTRVRELVAAHCGVPVAKIRIVSGHHSPSKIFSLIETR